MKPIKVFWMGEPLRNIYPHATKFQVFKYRVKRFIRKLVILLTLFSILSGSMYISFIIGSKMFPETVYAEKEKVVEVDAKSPVMERIALCESNNKHYGTSGQVLIKLNTNGSYDIGKYQINSLWNKKATELGYNLSLEKDNEDFAYWLYKNIGTSPWTASIKCWNR